MDELEEEECSSHRTYEYALMWLANYLERELRSTVLKRAQSSFDISRRRRWREEGGGEDSEEEEDFLCYDRLSISSLLWRRRNRKKEDGIRVVLTLF
jgi:hypothetical protein